MRVSGLLFVCALSAWAQNGKLRPEVNPPQNPQIRAEAIHMMEQATMVSSPVWPANEEVFTFRDFESGAGGTADGEIRIGVARPDLKRWEYTFGTYHSIQVRNGMEMAGTQTGSEPGIIMTVRRLIPIYLGQFEPADVIRSVESATVDGRAARCAVFETLKGEKEIPGRICVDAAQGWLLEVTQGDESIRNSNFYQFNNGYLPGHIEKWLGTRKVLEIDSHVVVRENYPADYFAYPENAAVRPTFACREYHRPYADNTPQPARKSNSNDAIDVRVHGLIGADGKPFSLTVLDNARPDLAGEALQVISGWTFHPARCEYKAVTTTSDFVVHFNGW